MSIFYSLIDANGVNLKSRFTQDPNFDISDKPGCRLFLDVLPTVDFVTKTYYELQPLPPEATEVIYVIVDIPPEPIESKINRFKIAIQNSLDTFAKTRGYDSIISAVSYANSENVTFAAEAQYCLNARDATWIAANTILTDFTNGTRVEPTIEEVLAELPVLVWPV